MARVEDRRRALELRKEGKSYSQIKSELGISKSTLSEWLRKYPLSNDQIRLLRAVNPIRIERYRQTMQRKRDKKLKEYYLEAEKFLLPLTKKELFIAGLFLYWGEGGKTSRGTLSINNTDPYVLKFSLFWMRKALLIPKERIKVYLHLYSDMNIHEELVYWSEELNIPLSQFMKPYIKQSKKADLDQKGFGHGTCGLRVLDTIIKEKTLMSIKVAADYAGGKTANL